jgi:TetR/AcrR family transcriptional regulator, transcriptional repressor for nem operon
VGRTSDARERLIAATIDLIWPTSYGAVGVDAICEKAGVKKGSFYHFFASKDELVVAALDAHWEARRIVFDRIFSPSVPPLERLRGYFAHVVERQTEVRKKYGRILGCFHNSVGTECIQKTPAIAAKVQEVISLYRLYFETALRDAQAAGLVRRGDPPADAMTLFAYVEGVVAQARIHDDLEMLRHLADTAFSLFGVAAPVDPPRPRARA